MLSLLLTVVVALLIVGLVLWAVQQFPIDPMISNLIRVAVIVIVAIWVIMAISGNAGLSLPR